MRITLENIGKKFNREWIFREIHFDVKPGGCVAITGGNGSGKSTLSQLLGGYVTPSAGRVSWELKGKKMEADRIYEFMTWATPNVSLYDEFTLRENIEFFLQFKKIQMGNDIAKIAETMNLSSALNKNLKNYSSGMKQRVKLGLSILSDSPLLILDEPVSHLDKENTQWFMDLLKQYKNERTLIVASNNNESEIFLCDQKIIMDDYRKSL